jgi:hypothetical protein
LPSDVLSLVCYLTGFIVVLETKYKDAQADSLSVFVPLDRNLKQETMIAL